MKGVFVFLKNILLKIWTAIKGGFRYAIAPLPFSRLNRMQWLYLPRLLSPREKLIILTLAAIMLISGAALIGRLYLKVTVPKPASGGTYREGLFKEPRFVNPIYASSDTDRDLTELIFSGLIRYSQDGQMEPDLAETVEIGDGAKTYTVRLKKSIFWHDGERLDADDVVFTIKTIQNPEFKSPLRPNWQGVLVEKIDERTVRFTLRQPYVPFIENLAVGIVPEHLWVDIAPQSSPLSDLNLKPIGSGPYKFDTFARLGSGSIASYTLTRFRSFHRAAPNLTRILFSFYPSETELIAAYRKKEIDGVGIVSAKHLPELQKTDITMYAVRLPRIVALFLNETQQGAFADRNVRMALAKAIDTHEIITKVLNGGGDAAASPIPPGSAGFDPDIPPTAFDPDGAKTLLDNAGWKDANNDGVREKKERKQKKLVETPLKIEIATSDFPEFIEVANLIKEMWQKIGISAEVKTLGATELETSIIKPRAYQVLLFGEIFSHDPDPFAFWHTSQIKDPGLNIALYSNRKADAILEEARRTTDHIKREEKYREFQKIVVGDLPAIFLYSPLSYYGVRSAIKGIAVDRIALPHERFSYIERWYIKTRRGLR